MSSSYDPSKQTPDDPILFSLEGHVAVLTLNKPQTRNALSGEEMFQAFESIFEYLNQNHHIRASVLTGAGTAFCSGGNIAEMRDKEGMFKGDPKQIAQNYKAGIQRIPRAFQKLEVPMIAAVNGAAIGAGNDLACMCDIRIASEKAIFAESFVKVGIIPGDGGCWLLPRVIGYANAAQMALSGDSIDAQEALRMGLVSKVVSADDLVPQALAMAQSMAKNPPQVLRWTKRLMQEARNSTLDQALERAGEFQGLAHQTSDHMEALNAFFDKREPHFTGH
jgi:2-(1,2-epoxy-1,2-dihydrophenyl)acetyl-CoA isomerase